MSTPSKTPVTDAILEYLRVQFPATEGHVPLREMIGNIERERNDLAQWKREAMEVESWWQKIDAAIRVHPDAVVGRSAADEALRFIQELDKIKIERGELWREIAAAKHGDSGYAVLQERHEKQLAEKTAQIVALREALQGCSRCRDCDGDGIVVRQHHQTGEPELEQCRCCDMRQQALSTPPPAVVPLEDVRPLVVAIKQCTQFTIHPSMSEQNLISATKQFTAKHPL